MKKSALVALVALVLMVFLTQPAFAFGKKPTPQPSPTPTPMPTYTPAPESDQAVLDRELYWAVGKNDLEKVRTLLRRGANPNSRQVGNPVLTQAAIEGDLPIVQELVNAGADVNGGERPLSRPLSASVSYPAIAHFLLERGADPNLDEALFGQQAPIFTWAVSQNSCLVGDSGQDLVTVIEDMIAHGADLSRRDYFGDTALFRIQCSDGYYYGSMAVGGEAGFEVYRRVAGLLLWAGLDVNARASDGTSALLALMVPRPNEPMHRKELVAKVDFLVSQGADLLALDNGGNNALMLSVKGGYAELRRHFLSLGRFDLNQRNREGTMALHFAASNGDSAAAVALLDAGACVSAKDGFGRTALELATDGGHPQLAETLRGYGERPVSERCRGISESAI
ncbi:MAG: ankyrin repeat domain-containing protein [Oligoflexia bacterium]|nr:ankyrin repeat domain-containing protein [Oligoflexia bacterium]